MEKISWTGPSTTLIVDGETSTDTSTTWNAGDAGEIIIRSLWS